MGTEDNTPAPRRSFGEETSAKAAPAMPAGKKTAEEWAADKGMLDATRAKKYPKAKKPLIHNKAHAPFKAAKASLKWPIGMELTEKEFDEAIALNGGPPVKGIEAHVFR